MQSPCRHTLLTSQVWASAAHFPQTLASEMPHQLADLHTAATQIAALVAEDTASEEQNADAQQQDMPQPEPVHQPAAVSSADTSAEEEPAQVTCILLMMQI